MAPNNILHHKQEVCYNSTTSLLYFSSSTHQTYSKESTKFI